MLKNYFSIAIRNLARNKAYGILNIVGLALSITCGILIFALVKYHLSFDNFHPDKDRIYRFVTEQHRDAISYTGSVPPAFGPAFRNDYPFGEKVARIVSFDELLVSIGNGPDMKKFNEREGVAYVEPAFFDIFNFPLLSGDKSTVLTEPNTAIITASLAKKYFGTTEVVNKTLRLNNKVECRITGVLKDLPANTDQRAALFVSWRTFNTQEDWIAKDNSWGGISSDLQCFTRLQPNVSPAQVESLLPAYVTKYRPKSKNVHHYKLQPLAEMHFDARYDGVMEMRNLWILSFIGVFLIITACVNFVNLATAQALRRSKEVGIRKVLGSFRGQLFWQFITETAVITAFAIVVAMVLALLLLPYVNSVFSVRLSIGDFLNTQLLYFILVLFLLVSFSAGTYPGLVMSGFRPVVALKGKLSMRSIGGFNTRRSLIVTQLTISLILIIGMIVITKQIQYAQQSDLGFDKEAVLMVPTGMDSAGSALNTLKRQLADIPGVEMVSVCYAPPSSESNWNTSVFFDGGLEELPFRVSMKAGDDQYVPAFGLHLLAGRNIFPSDSVREMLINEAFIRKLALKSPEDALGKKVVFNGGEETATVVGVLKDFHDRSFHEDINAVAITSYSKNYGIYALKINVKKGLKVLSAIEQTWLAMHPDKVYDYEFLDQSIAAFYSTEAMMSTLIRIFSVIAIFIGCLGLYGLVAFMVAQKTKEIGIRKVLGSSIIEILWIFGKEFSLLILVAFVLAAPVAWWLMNSWLAHFKFHISITPWIFVLSVAITFVVAAVTIGYQTIQAALMDPVKSLRAE